MGKTFGTLVLYSDVCGFFNPLRIDFFQGFAYQSAGVLEKANLFLEATNHLSLIESLRTIDLAILGSLDLQLTLKVALEETKKQLGAKAVAIWAQDLSTRSLEFTSGISLPGESLDTLKAEPVRALAVQVAKEKKTLRLAKLLKEGRKLQEKFSFSLFADVYATPLIAKGKTRGVLSVFLNDLEDRVPGWIKNLEMIAGQIAIAIDSSNLFHQLEEKHTELLDAYEETLEGWARALALKEDETEEHSR